MTRIQKRGSATHVVCCILCAFGFSGTAAATPSSGFTSSVLAVGTFDEIDVTNAGEAKVKIKTGDAVDVHTLFNTFVPGGHTGWHAHPGPSLVTVKAGTATLYSADDPTCTPHVYSAGTGFIDDGDDVHILRNESDVALEVIVVSIVPEGAARRIDKPNPGNCAF